LSARRTSPIRHGGTATGSSAISIPAAAAKRRASRWTSGKFLCSALGLLLLAGLLVS